MEKIALLVIDVINDFVVNEDCPLFCSEANKTIIKIKETIDLFHQRDFQVIFIKDAHREKDADFLVRPIHGVKGTWGAEMVAEIQNHIIQEDYIIDKRRYSAFSYTDLDLFLREEKIEHLVLIGGWTNTGIRSTASDAFHQAYKVTVLSNCCFSQTEEMQQSGLSDISMFGKVLTLEEFKENSLLNLK
ncbi:nicotinamidase-related amidase [Evansella vedderi]|uniref:Nicotinamidase-related amidase n=1 Tax=Evansella vedderi TaxID=38282 RepID=A0ABT9ZNS7_9BACI|nr:isochorismatase family cysteine hydrolase [Evansella vedderi]MDQ0252898.1 nicotinamidase-related amidase [Evansella vedderi]